MDLLLQRLPVPTALIMAVAESFRWDDPESPLCIEGHWLALEQRVFLAKSQELAWVLVRDHTPAQDPSAIEINLLRCQAAPAMVSLQVRNHFQVCLIRYALQCEILPLSLVDVVSRLFHWDNDRHPLREHPPLRELQARIDEIKAAQASKAALLELAATGRGERGKARKRALSRLKRPTSIAMVWLWLLRPPSRAVIGELLEKVDALDATTRERDFDAPSLIRWHAGIERDPKSDRLIALGAIWAILQTAFIGYRVTRDWFADSTFYIRYPYATTAAVGVAVIAGCLVAALPFAGAYKLWQVGITPRARGALIDACQSRRGRRFVLVLLLLAASGCLALPWLGAKIICAVAATALLAIRYGLLALFSIAIAIPAAMILTLSPLMFLFGDQLGVFLFPIILMMIVQEEATSALKRWFSRHNWSTARSAVWLHAIAATWCVLPLAIIVLFGAELRSVQPH